MVFGWSITIINCEIAPRAEEMAGEREINTCVRGYHVYKDIWAAAIQEVLVCSTIDSIYLPRIYTIYGSTGPTNSA